MLFNGKPLSQLTADDLQTLIDTQRQEDQFIDFKGHSYKVVNANELDPATRKERNEKFKTDLCTDVCAFANANGGWIICGMAENGGAAGELIPLKEFNADKDVLRLREIMDSGIEPRVPGIDMRVLSIADGEILLIHVPRSFNGPHRVFATRKFERRRLNGNREMDIQEIRQAFLGTSNIADHIRTFRRERIEAILDSEHPKSIAPLQDGPLFAVHLLPVGMAEAPFRVAFSTTEFAQKALWDTPDGMHFLQSISFNIEGVVLRLQPSLAEPALGYFQIFRSGAVEFVDTDNSALQRPEKLLNVNEIEHRILTALAQCVRLQKGLGIDEPNFIAVTLAKTKSFTWITHKSFGRPGPWPRTAQVSKHDPLYLPELYVESWERHLTQIMKPAFDIWANALSWSRSASYDANGTWIDLEKLHLPSLT